MTRIAVIAIVVMGALSGMAWAGGGKSLFTGPDGEAGNFPRIRQILAGLNLSPDQQTKTNAILDDAATAARTLRSQAKSSSDKTAIHEQMRSLRMQTVSKIEQVLTSDQRVQFRQQLRALRQEARQHQNRPTTQPNS
jgi:Spy/CpxP family protein refolding chaperone